MVKRRVFSLLSLLLFSFSSVSAVVGVADSAARASFGLSQIISAIFGPFFGAVLGSSPDYLFEHILIFLVIFCATYMAAQRVKVLSDNKAVIIIVTISVSVLAARFMAPPLIVALLLPYRSLGIVLTAILPILIGFFFITQFHSSAIVRKIFWIFYTVVFVAMWAQNYAVAGPIAWMYFWTALISVMFFLFDGTIMRALIRQRMRDTGRDNAQHMESDIRRRIVELEEDKANGIFDNREGQYKRMKRDLHKQLKNLYKYY